MNVLGRTLIILFLGMIIAGAVISFSGWMVDSDPEFADLYWPANPASVTS